MRLTKRPVILIGGVVVCNGQVIIGRWLRLTSLEADGFQGRRHDRVVIHSPIVTSFCRSIQEKYESKVTSGHANYFVYVLLSYIRIGGVCYITVEMERSDNVVHALLRGRLVYIIWFCQCFRSSFFSHISIILQRVLLNR